jgi:hypothetical protein
LLLQLAVALDPGLSDGLLGRSFKQKFIDGPNGQTLGQVVEGTVFMTPMVAMAVGFATARETLDQRSPQAIRGNLELGKKPALALAQSQGRFAFGSVNPSHIYGEDAETPHPVNKKENAPANAKLLNHRRFKALTTILLKTYETAAHKPVAP